MPEQQIPYCLALMLCDAIERDERTGKYNLVGTFSRLRGDIWPLRGRFSVYFAITDGFGPVPLSLKFIDSKALIDRQDPVAHVDAEETACEALDLPPGDCMMVAAHTNDLLAAAACGLRTGHVARPNERGPGTGEAAPKAPVDVAGSDLEDLAGKLGA